MTPLERTVIKRIREEGPIPFEAFMEMALYYPALGYYTSPHLEIGRKGDFYTGPHLHTIFGTMIGKQLEEMWEFLRRPPVFLAVEIGGGTGYLCKDMLDFLKDREIFNSICYVIVEINPVMKERQRNLLSDYLHKVTWTSSLKELVDIKGCIFSNELPDAFPVHVIEMEDTLKEIYVKFDGRHIREHKHDISNPALLRYLEEYNIEIPYGYRTEINLRIKDWLREISEVLSEGFVLTIDYGYCAEEYYSENRNRGTLLCYHRHRLTENPYENIGGQDITAHINFSSLKKWGEEFGLRTMGYCRQGTYLISLGMDEEITKLYGDSPDYLSYILNIKNLFLPQGIGESHKVMIQYKGEGLPTLKGFSLRNQKALL